MKRPLKPISAKPPAGGGGVTPTQQLCLMCWGNGMVMHRYRVGILRRWTFDLFTCPRCAGTGRTGVS